jgi:hypothetical protein
VTTVVAMMVTSPRTEQRRCRARMDCLVVAARRGRIQFVGSPLTATLRGSARSTIFFVLLLAADVLLVVVVTAEEAEEFLVLSVRSMRKGGEKRLFGSMRCDSDLDNSSKAGGDRARWPDSGRGGERGVDKMNNTKTRLRRALPSPQCSWRTRGGRVRHQMVSFAENCTELKI